MTWKERVSPSDSQIGRSDSQIRGLGNRTAGTWYASTIRQGTARIRVCLNRTSTTSRSDVDPVAPSADDDDAAD